MKKKVLILMLAIVMILSACGGKGNSDVYSTGSVISKDGKMKSEIYLYGSKEKISKIEMKEIQSKDKSQLDEAEKAEKRWAEKYKNNDNVNVRIEKGEQTVTTITTIDISSKDKIENLVKLGELPAIFENQEKISSEEINGLFPEVVFKNAK